MKFFHKYKQVKTNMRLEISSMPMKLKNKYNFWMAAILLLGLLVVTSGADAAVNPKFAYQGKLKNELGLAVPDGSYNLDFKICSDSDCTTVLWTETHCYSTNNGATCTGSGTDQRIIISDGVFNLLLGNITSLAGLNYDQTLYLEVRVGGNGNTPTWETLLPRKELASVPSSMNSDKLDNLNAASTGDDEHILKTDALGNITSSASITATDNLNVGADVIMFRGSADRLDLATGDSLNVVSGSMQFGGTTVIDSARYAQNLTRITVDNINLDANTISATNDSGLSLLDNAGNGIVVTDGGNVGIGTSAPNNKLDITGSSIYTQLRLSETKTDATLNRTGIVSQHYTAAEEPLGMILGRSDASTSEIYIGGGYSGVNAATTLSFLTASNNTTINGTERMRINSVGNIGIGTSSPNAKVDIYGTSNSLRLSYDTSNYSTLSTDSNGVLSIISSGTGGSYMYAGGGLEEDVAIIYDGNAQDYYMGLDDTDDALKIGLGTAVGGSPFVTILSSGNVGIGTSSPSANLHVVNNSGAGATNKGFLLHIDDTAFTGNSSTPANNGGGMVITADASASSSFDFFAAISSAGGTDDAEFRVRGDGNVYGDGAVYNSGADYAEYFYTKDTDLMPGEAVCLNENENEEVMRCERDADSNVIGIISTNPAFVGNNIPGAEADLGEINDKYKLVGLIGQVPAKVSNENGDIKTGDSLTPASKAGYLRKANPGESTVGVSLQYLTNKSEGEIKVLISRKNKTITVESIEAEIEERIAKMSIEDEINLLFGNFENKITALDSSFSASLDEVKDLMDIVIEQNEAVISFANTINANSLIYKDTDGNLNLLEGKLEAKEVVAGAFSVRISDEDAKTIGTAKITPVKVDENSDGFDDSTGSDGKSVIVETEALKAGTKVFVTSKNVTEQPLAVTDVVDGESFKVEIKSALEEDEEISFDWWVVEAK